MTKDFASGFDGFAEDDAGREVDQGHAAHGDVGKGPGGVHRCDGADEDDCYADNVEPGHEFLAGHFFAVEVGEAVVNVEEIADECREREERERYRDEDGPEAAKDSGQGVLYIGCAAYFFARDYAGAQAHESCGGAEQECVDVDGEHLHESLLDRVRDVSGSGGVRRGADAGFVGVKAALDAVDQA